MAIEGKEERSNGDKSNRARQASKHNGRGAMGRREWPEGVIHEPSSRVTKPPWRAIARVSEIRGVSLLQCSSVHTQQAKKSKSVYVRDERRD